jgi:hypothetical protein
MSKKLSTRQSECLKDEKERLNEEIYRCDFCSFDYSDHSRCYQQAAKASGSRSRDCMS